MRKQLDVLVQRLGQDLQILQDRLHRAYRAQRLHLLPVPHRAPVVIRRRERARDRLEHRVQDPLRLAQDLLRLHKVLPRDEHERARDHVRREQLHPPAHDHGIRRAIRRRRSARARRHWQQRHGEQHRVREPRHLLTRRRIVERPVDLDHGHLVDHAVHHPVHQIRRVVDRERVEAHAPHELIGRVELPHLPVAHHHQPRALLHVLIVEIELDQHLLPLAVPQLADVHIHVLPVRGQDRRRPARDFADPEPVRVDDFHVELHVEQTDGHHTADAPRDAVPEVVPVLDERVRPVGVVGHEPEGGGVVGAAVAKGVDGHIGGFGAGEDEVHLSASSGVGGVADEEHARDGIAGFAL